jgi:hypothetical protein
MVKLIPGIGLPIAILPTVRMAAAYHDVNTVTRKCSARYSYVAGYGIDTDIVRDRTESGWQVGGPVPTESNYEL